MVKFILMAVMVLAVAGCKKNSSVEDGGLIGKWKLTESYADPGDGSGTWHMADPSNPQYLEFRDDGRLIFSPADMYDSDHYQVTSDSTMNFIRGSESFPMRYHLSENMLSLFPPCIEGCGLKYISVMR
jgi:hypothetical protein